MVINFSASAQLVDINQATETIYGLKVANNKNLRFTSAQKVHTEVSAGAHMSGGDGGYNAYGVDLTVRRQYKVGSWGAVASSEYSEKYGMANATYLMGGVRFGKTVSFGVDGLAGFGQAHETIYSSNAVGATHEYKVGHWRPQLGVQANFNINLSKGWMISAYGRYIHSFVSDGQTDLAMFDSWRVNKQVNDANRWSAGLSLTRALYKNGQVSGDNCWEGQLVGGYSNLGANVGVKAVHFKRTAAHTGTAFGLGTMYTFNKGVTTNQVLGHGGIRLLPKGADSPFVFDFFGELAIGQFEKIVEGSTENKNEFRMGSNLYSFGGSGTVHAGVSYHKGCFSVGVNAFAGGYLVAGTDFEGAHGYDGTYKTNGGLYGGQATVSVAF